MFAPSNTKAFGHMSGFWYRDEGIIQGVPLQKEAWMHQGNHLCGAACCNCLVWHIKHLPSLVFLRAQQKWKSFNKELWTSTQDTRPCWCQGQLSKQQAHVHILTQREVTKHFSVQLLTSRYFFSVPWWQRTATAKIHQPAFSAMLDHSLGSRIWTYNWCTNKEPQV